RFVEAFGPVGFQRETFHPSYGLAESTVYVTGVREAVEPVVCRFSAAALASGRAELADRDAPDQRPLVGCGRPPDGSVVRIVDPETRKVLPAGRTGEIWVQSASVAAGYWGRPEETRAAFQARVADGSGGH